MYAPQQILRSSWLRRIDCNYSFTIIISITGVLFGQLTETKKIDTVSQVHCREKKGETCATNFRVENYGNAKNKETRTPC